MKHMDWIIEDEFEKKISELKPRPVEDPNDPNKWFWDYIEERNKRMIEDLRSRNIAVEQKYLRYAKLSRNLVAGTLVASIATMYLTSIDELFILPPLFVIPMVVFTEKQRRVSLDAYQRASGSIEPSYRNTFHVSLVPTSNSLSLVGTF